MKWFETLWVGGQTFNSKTHERWPLFFTKWRKGRRKKKKSKIGLRKSLTTAEISGQWIPITILVTEQRMTGKAGLHECTMGKNNPQLWKLPKPRFSWQMSSHPKSCQCHFLLHYFLQLSNPQLWQALELRRAALTTVLWLWVSIPLWRDRAVGLLSS